MEHMQMSCFLFFSKFTLVLPYIIRDLIIRIWVGNTSWYSPCFYSRTVYLFLDLGAKMSQMHPNMHTNCVFIQCEPINTGLYLFYVVFFNQIAKEKYIYILFCIYICSYISQFHILHCFNITALTSFFSVEIDFLLLK